MASTITKALLGGKLMFPSEYVAAIEFKGRDVTLTIASVRLEDLAIRGGKKERKPVLTFKETRKKLVLNKTNAGTIADAHGAAAEGWAGKQITLYPSRTQCGRDTVDCIRVRERARPNAAPMQFDEPEVRPDEFSDDGFSQLVSGDSSPQPPAEGSADPAQGTAPGSVAEGDVDDQFRDTTKMVDGPRKEEEKAPADDIESLYSDGGDKAKSALYLLARTKNPKMSKAEFEGGLFKFAQGLGAGVSVADLAPTSWANLHRAIDGGRFDFKTGIVGR